MNRRTEFDDLRPYYDEEIPSAMERLATSDILPQVASFVYPNHDIEVIRRLLRNTKSVYEFQHTVMRAFSERVIRQTIRHFTYDGLDHLTHGRSYLYLSNHRDIVLDSALLQYALFLEGFPTTEISFGSNLMISQLVIDIGRSNKMYKVIRGGNRMELFNHSMHLSQYLHYTIGEKNESVWIAQRNGRTKNGIDHTDVGIINMFSMSNRDDLIHSLSDLHIVPMTISYEWEPCDLLKAVELYKSQDKPYVKAPNEDLNSIITGLTQYKGDVHVTIGEELTEEYLNSFANLSRGEFTKQVAAEVDRQIDGGYHYYPNNYIAADLLHEDEHYAASYSAEQKNEFITYLHQKLSDVKDDKEEIRRLLLGIYAGRL